MSDDKEHDILEFSDDERERLRKMLIAHERVEWFWSTAGVWIKWIGAIGAGAIAAKLLLGDLKELFKGWLK